MTPAMQSKPTRPPIKNEANNGLKNKTGTIAMARTTAPHSATSQFFINTADNAFLDHAAQPKGGWGYCVFGYVTEGMEVVRAIENVETGLRAGHRDVPVTSIMIQRVSVIQSPVADKAAHPEHKN